MRIASLFVLTAFVLSFAARGFAQDNAPTPTDTPKDAATLGLTPDTAPKPETQATIEKKAEKLNAAGEAKIQKGEAMEAHADALKAAAQTLEKKAPEVGGKEGEKLAKEAARLDKKADHMDQTGEKKISHGKHLKAKAAELSPKVAAEQRDEARVKEGLKNPPAPAPAPAPKKKGHKKAAAAKAAGSMGQ